MATNNNDNDKGEQVASVSNLSEPKESESNNAEFDNSAGSNNNAETDDNAESSNNVIEDVQHSPGSSSEVYTDEARSDQLNEFAVQLASYTHDSWFAQWPDGELMLQLKTHDRANQHISSEIASLMELNQVLPDDLGRLCVLDVALSEGKEIQNIVWHLGLIVLGSNLKTTLDGNRIRSIVDAIGLEGLQFSVKNAGRFLLSNGEEYPSLQSTYDEKFEYLKELVIQSGLELLCVMCGSNSVEIYQRILLKLPFKWSVGLMPNVNVELDESAEQVLSELQASKPTSSIDLD